MNAVIHDGVVSKFVSNKLRAKYVRPNGSTFTARRHTSLKSFNRATAPIATGSDWSGEAFHEHEYMRDGERHIRVAGREFLTSVNTFDRVTYALLGERLAVIPVAPEALGGRLAVFADQFEQHKLIKARVIYEPVVPTTSVGAIVMYFRNDVGTTDIDLGRDELVHAATHPSFIQTSVWDAASIEVSPSDANLKFFNDESGDFRSQAQGEIIIETGDPIAANQTYGNLYFEYDFEFYSPELTYDVVDTPETLLHINQATGGSESGGDPFIVVSPSGGAALPNFAMGPVGSPVAVTPADMDYIYVLIVDEVVDGQEFPAFTTPGSSATFEFTAGMAFYARITRDDSGGTVDYALALFSSLADASNGGSYKSADAVPGQIVYAPATWTWTPGTGYVGFRVRRWQAPDH